jgi:hypothetical protein
VNRVAFLSLCAAPLLFGAAPQRVRIRAYRDIRCGCCEQWMHVMEAGGFDVDLSDLDRAERLQRFALTETIASCHTAVLQNYLVEGHVPPAYVRELLHERPPLRGIALPGMPSGVGGMTGAFNGPLDIVTIETHTRVWRTIKAV